MCPDPYANVNEVFGLRSAGPTSSSLYAIKSATDGRRGAQGLTCISCGLQYVRDRLSGLRSSAMPVLVLLSDGRQTTCGDAVVAISVAAELKARGFKIAIVTHDDSDMVVLRQIASSPQSVYLRPTEQSIAGARNDIEAMIYATCPEVLNVCPLTQWCHEPLRVAIHGHGFAGGGGGAPGLQCCVGNNDAGNTCANVVPVRAVDSETLICESENAPSKQWPS